MRILALVRDVSHAQGEAVNLIQFLTEIANRGHVVDVVYAQSRGTVPTGPVADQLHRIADRRWTVGHTDYSIYWSPPRLLRWTRGRLRQLAGLFHDIIRITPSVLCTVARVGRRRADVVFEVRQFGMTWSAPVARLIGAALVCQVNVVIDTHARRDRLLLAPADRVVAVSKFVKDVLVEIGVPTDRIQMVHNGIDTDRYPYGDRGARDAQVVALGLDPELPVVLYYGQLNPIKGVEVLLRAAGKVRRPFQLVVAGRYTDESYHTEVDRAATGLPHVTWLGQQEDVVAILHAADVVVLPSTGEEAFGRVLIEAMSTGRPAVGSRIGGIPEVLTGEFASLLCTPGDPDDLARVLDTITDWRDRDPDLALRCRWHVEQAFTLDQNCDALETAFRAAIADRRRRKRSNLKRGTG